MPERSSNPGNQTENRGKGKKPHDANVHAFNIVQQAIGEKPKEHSAEKPKRIRLRLRWATRWIEGWEGKGEKTHGYETEVDRQQGCRGEMGQAEIRSFLWKPELSKP